MTPAAVSDLPAIRGLLDAERLPSSDLDASLLSSFIVLRADAEIHGVIGLEVLGEVALVRSLVVTQSQRGRGLGASLVQAVEKHANAAGVRTLYLLTTSAADFFTSLGYRAIPRESAPVSIQQTSQFAGLCPSTAIVMVKP